MDHKIAIMLRRIYERRRELQLTQAEAARRAGIRQSNYCRLESGRQIPNMETLLAVMDALNLRIDIHPADVTVYHVMHRERPVCDVTVSADRKSILFEKKVKDGLLQPFSGSNLTVERFYRFLKSRCYEDDRADLKEILDEAHFDTNNPYDWVALTHGVTRDDFFWIKINEEALTWNEVRLRR